MSYSANIVTKIPSDIAADQHAAIEAKIAEINARIGTIPYATRMAAIDAAANALHASGVGACGYASCVNAKSGKRFH